MYEIIYSPTALKVLLKMPQNQATLIMHKINDLKATPYARNNNIKKLKGAEGYRLRIGKWRVIYHIEDKILNILVVNIGTRGEIYK